MSNRLNYSTADPLPRSNRRAAAAAIVTLAASVATVTVLAAVALVAWRFADRPEHAQSFLWTYALIALPVAATATYYAATSFLELIRGR